MPATFSIPQQLVIPGQLIASALWNNEFTNIYNGFTPAGIDTYSVTDTQMQLQTNPYPGSVTSHATSLAGEVERLRYQVSQIVGKSYWYQKPTATLESVGSFILPIGAVIDYPSAAPPNSNFALCNGQTLNRVSNSALFSLMSFTVVASTANTSTTVTCPTTNIQVGMALDGAGIPVGTTVASIGSGNITISNAATATGSSITLTICPYGNGDGLLTFNIPNYTDRMSIGAGNLYSIGKFGGAVSHTLTLAEIPTGVNTFNDPGHAHSVTDPVHSHGVTDPGHTHTEKGAGGFLGPYNHISSITSGSPTAGATPDTTSSSTTGITVDGNSTGVTVNTNSSGITFTDHAGGTSHSILNPYIAMYKMIRVL